MQAALPGQQRLIQDNSITAPCHETRQSVGGGWGALRAGGGFGWAARSPGCPRDGVSCHPPVLQGDPWAPTAWGPIPGMRCPVTPSSAGRPLGRVLYPNLGTHPRVRGSPVTYGDTPDWFLYPQLGDPSLGYGVSCHPQPHGETPRQGVVLPAWGVPRCEPRCSDPSGWVSRGKES